MSIAPKSMRKAARIVLLGMLALSLSGCIFLRLNTFRKQMGNFTEYASFKIENHHPVVYFKKPVLRVSDIAWLGGEPPSTTTGTVKKEYSATWKLVKLYPQERIPEKDNYDLHITLDSKGNKVHRLEMPVRFRQVINEEVMDLFFDKADDADIEKKETSAAWSMANSPILPSMRDIIKTCGQPYAYESTKTEISITYKYHLVPPVTEKTTSKKSGEKSVDVDATLTYRNPGKGFLRSKVKVGKIHFTNIGDGKGAFKVRV